MMMVAIIMAISYVMIMFKMVDEIDNGYADDDDWQWRLWSRL